MNRRPEHTGAIIKGNSGKTGEVREVRISPAMVFRGHIHNGQVVLDEPARLVEGVEVRVSPLGFSSGAPTSQTEGSHDTETEVAVEHSFHQLVTEWNAATALTSSGTELLLHPAYQRIIGLGKDAVKLIIEELRREPDHWFWALKAITGEDPVAGGDHGKIDRMTASWLALFVADDKPTHAARQLSDGSWTSKLGKWIDILIPYARWWGPCVETWQC